LNVEAPVLATDFRRSWLLPLMQHVHGAPLAFYMRELLPLAVKLRQRLHELQELPAKLYAAVETQLWALLPKFIAHEAPDFCEVFPALCPILGGC